MPPELALECEQDQRLDQGYIAEEWRESEAYREAEARFSRLKVGKHPLCACRMKQRQDCDCPF